MFGYAIILMLDISSTSRRAGIVCRPLSQPVSITGSNDDLRTGWYANQTNLSPTTVQSSKFGQLFALNVDGQVYAQPLVSSGVLIIVTEKNNAYGFDSRTGAQHWIHNLGVPWNPLDVDCRDLLPSIGITGTPVIDIASETVYMFSKTYDTNRNAAWFAHALDIFTGKEKQNFPVRIQGSATNDPNVTFDAKFAMQRPALLLMNDVVYAGFGGHCDKGNYRGWVIGVSVTGKLNTLFSTTVGEVCGAGIWQSGGGLVSDIPGTIIFATGNIKPDYEGLGNLPIVGSHPPASLDEAVVRLSVEPNGNLRAVDFFVTADTDKLDIADLDLGSGSPVALPEPYFGTPTVPRLLVQIGKQGRLMLLDRDNLGGYRTAAALGDNLLAETYVDGGLWGRPSIWGGDGGYLYLVPNGSPLTVVKYAVDGIGNPSIAIVGKSAEVYGYTSGSPIVTSDAAQSGTALVWVIGSNDADGAGAALRAYDALPADGILVLRFEKAIGNAAKFAVPGVDNGRVYVGTRDGMVYCYGSPVNAPLNGRAITFIPTVVSQSQAQQLVVTANQDLIITIINSTSSDFVISPPLPTLPCMLSKDGVLSFMIKFTPVRLGPVSAAITFTTNVGVASVTLSGQGIQNGPAVYPSKYTISFTGTTIGTKRYNNIAIYNKGSQTLVINTVIPPVLPFSSNNLPAVGTTVAPGAAFIVGLDFEPKIKGAFYSVLKINTNGGTSEIGITGTAALPGKLDINMMLIDFGTVAIGETAIRNFSLTNVGEEVLIITKSKAPSIGQFTALTNLDEGTRLQPNTTIYEKVAFTPTSKFQAKDFWTINANDNGKVRNITFIGNN